MAGGGAGSCSPPRGMSGGGGREESEGEMRRLCSLVSGQTEK